MEQHALTLSRCLTVILGKKMFWHLADSFILGQICSHTDGQRGNTGNVPYTLLPLKHLALKLLLLAAYLSIA